MNYTLTQAIDRTRDLSGAIKAADELERLTADTLGAKEHEVTLARQAHDKAVANQEALRTEREELAEHVKALVRKVGEPLEISAESAQIPEPLEGMSNWPDGEAVAPLNAFDTFGAFNSNDLADRLMLRSEEKLNEAYAEARL